MTHAPPDRVTVRLLPDGHLAEVTFFGPTLPAQGAPATYPRADVIEYLAIWLAEARLEPDAATDRASARRAG